jgi:hypothetical protein
MQALRSAQLAEWPRASHSRLGRDAIKELGRSSENAFTAVLAPGTRAQKRRIGRVSGMHVVDCPRTRFRASLPHDIARTPKTCHWLLSPQLLDWCPERQARGSDALASGLAGSGSI